MKAYEHIKVTPSIGETSKPGYRRAIENRIPCKTYSNNDF